MSTQRTAKENLQALLENDGDELGADDSASIIRSLLVNGRTSPELDNTGYGRSNAGYDWWEGGKVSGMREARDIADLAAEYETDTRQIEAHIEVIEGLNREELTELALSQSLCPMHLVDYAICFDDNDPACYQIRMVHPAHDT